MAEPRQTANDGTRPNPVPRYLFRLYGLVTGNGGYPQRDANGALTNGISKSVSWWDRMCWSRTTVRCTGTLAG